MRAAWYAAILLLLLAMLMVTNIGLVAVQANFCNHHLGIMVEALQHGEGALTGNLTVVEYLATECAHIDNEFDETVDGYLELLLVLLGGAGVAGAVASSSKKEHEG